MKLQILRTSDNGIQTESVIYVVNDKNKIVFSCFGLEPPWKNNDSRVSCIPAWKYIAIKHNSPKFGQSFWIQNVPGRSEILIHKGNYHYNTLGCPLVGDDLRDINKDGLMDVTNSGETMKKLWALLPNKFEVEITYRF